MAQAPLDPRHQPQSWHAQAPASVNLHPDSLLRGVLESSSDAIFLLDCEERHVAVNTRALALLGLGEDEIVGQAISPGQVHPPQLVALYRQTVRQKIAASAEFPTQRRYGSVHCVLARAFPLFDSDSSLSGVIVSVRDISAEKMLAQQLAQSQSLAAVGAMIGGVAHELNNPLTGILGFSDLLHDMQTTQESRRYIQLLQQQARRAAEIVRNLSYFAAPASSGKSRVQLADMIERTLSLHAYSLRKNGIKVDFVREPGLPYVLVDAQPLMRVALTLIVNAERSIRSIKEKGTLRISLGTGGESVWATFSDDGPSPPAETLAIASDSPQADDPTVRTQDGGLNLCESLMAEQGGTIQALAMPEGGAAFTITLPAASGSESV